jgi:hypothetical protein
MDLPRLLFITVTSSAVIGGSFVMGLHAGLTQNAIFDIVHGLYGSIRQAFQAVDETSLLEPDHLLQPARGQGEGVTVNRVAADGALILLAGFFEKSNELRLVRRDGSIVRRWPVSFSALFPDSSHMSDDVRPATDWNIDLHGALALPDGSIVFNFEYGGLTRLDRCGRTVWTLAHMTHHSIEPAAGGGFWVPGRRHHPAESKSPFPPFAPPFAEDLVLRVSDDGKILSEFSVPELFYDNGLTPVLTATGDDFRRGRDWDREIVHLNKITELSAARAGMFPMFEAGDLMLSLRELNMVMVVDPASRDVRWWQIGPWIRQHDPQFARDGWITVFNNNAYKDVLKGYRTDASLPRTSSILAMNPATRETAVRFGGRPGQEMLSVLRGKQHETERGLFITESEAGRVIETDAAGRVVWEYVNSYDPENVAEITEARLYPKDFFSVADWSCAAAGP